MSHYSPEESALRGRAQPRLSSYVPLPDFVLPLPFSLLFLSLPLHLITPRRRMHVSASRENRAQRTQIRSTLSRSVDQLHKSHQ